MFEGSPTTFDGNQFVVRSAYNEPRPLQEHVPILVGGSGPRRSLRIVATHADISNFVVRDGHIPVDKLAILVQHCESIGRDPNTILKTAFLPSPGTPADVVQLVGQLFNSGFGGVVLANSDAAPATIRAWGDALTAAFG